MDEQTSQPAEDRYSSRVDELETDVEQPDEEWFDDGAGEDQSAQRGGQRAQHEGRPGGRPSYSERSRR